MHPIEAPSPNMPGPNSTHRAFAATLAVIVLIGLSACSGEEPSRADRFPYIHEPNFKVENPSRDRASATGIGCGGTEKEALAEARETAKFNLRGVTGNAKYKVRFHILREIPRKNRFCVEVKATAMDAV